jgi:hypothetical protein
MYRRSLSAGMLALLCAASAAPISAQRHDVAATTTVPGDSATFIVLHGADTVARERFSRTDTELRGTLSLTGASRGVQQYTAVLAPDATVPLVEVMVREFADSGQPEGRIVQRARVIFRDDSAAVDALTDEGIRTHVVGTTPGAVPYLNLSFALLEQAARRARRLGAGTVEVPFFNLGGGQTAVGRFASAGADSLKFTIGEVEYRLRVDAVGRLLSGAIPAQNVVVERR